VYKRQDHSSSVLSLDVGMGENNYVL